jgi:3-oxoacyl-[acyl-carrier protein] reductase
MGDRARPVGDDGMSDARAAERERPVALVTGASGALGVQWARAFVEAGWRVAAAGHTRTPKAESDWIVPMRIDVTSSESVEAGARAVLERLGRIDVLVNNAGVTADAALTRMSDAEWDRALDVNLKGAFLCSRAVWGAMTRQGGGVILNVASVAGRTGGAAGQANYVTAKAGLIGLTLALAREGGPLGIRVNAILPCVVESPMTEGLSASRVEELARASVLGRWGDASEVCRLGVELAKSREVSGQVFGTDGRVTRWC